MVGGNGKCLQLDYRLQFYKMSRFFGQRQAINKTLFIVGTAIKEIHQIKMTSPAYYSASIVHLDNYSIFYIPLTEQEHIYQVFILGLNDQGELIYGKNE